MGFSILRTENYCGFGRRTWGVTLLSLLFITGTPPPAIAQTVAPPGGIIITRDVPTRRAYLPGEPGQVNAIETVPTQTILDTTSLAGVRLTDEEIAAVSSGEPASLSGEDLSREDLMTSKRLAAIGGLSAKGQQGASLSTNPLGQGIGSSINATVGAGTNALQGALSTIGSALPGGD